MGNKEIVNIFIYELPLSMSSLNNFFDIAFNDEFFQMLKQVSIVHNFVCNEMHRECNKGF